MSESVVELREHNFDPNIPEPRDYYGFGFTNKQHRVYEALFWGIPFKIELPPGLSDRLASLPSISRDIAAEEVADWIKTNPTTVDSIFTNQLLRPTPPTNNEEGLK